MNVGFYLDLPTDQFIWLAKAAAGRARNAFPTAKLTLLTVLDFPTVLDSTFDRVLRLQLPNDCFYGHRKCLAHSMVEGEWLFLDVDCMAQKDVSHVFNSEFDVALCLRYFSKMVEKNPFNGGVSFSRCPQFWIDVAGKPEDHKGGQDTETRFSKIGMDAKYVVRCLNGNLYNYSPDISTDTCEGKYIVHYKGQRKNFLYDSLG